MFTINHPAASQEVYTSFSAAEKVLRSLEYVTREPGVVVPVAPIVAPEPPLVTAPVVKKWFWQ